MRQEPEPEILNRVGILILIHQNIFEARLILLKHIAVRFQDRQHVQQKIAKITGVECFQPLLILCVEQPAFAIGKPFTLSRVNICRYKALVFPLINQPAERFWRPALFVQLIGSDKLFDETELIIHIQNCEVALQSHQFGMTAQHLCADGVECAEPGHPFNGIANDAANPLFHFAGSFVCEGYCQNFRRPSLAGGDQVRKTGRERRGLARARACQHQNRPFARQHGFALRRIEAAQILRFVDMCRVSHPRTLRERFGC